MHKLIDNATKVVLENVSRTGNEGSNIVTGTAVDLVGEGRKVCVLAANVSGTNTTSITIQQSASLGSGYTTLATLTTLAVGETTWVDLTPTQRYIRAYSTLRETNGVAIGFTVFGIVYNERYRPSKVA